MPSWWLVVGRLGAAWLAAVLQGTTGHGTEDAAEGCAFETATTLIPDDPACSRAEQCASDGALSRWRVVAISATSVATSRLIGAVSPERDDDAGTQRQAKTQRTESQEAKEWRDGHGVKIEDGFRRCGTAIIRKEYLIAFRLRKINAGLQGLPPNWIDAP